MINYKNVTKKEFIEFVNNYHNKLKISRVGICYPPQINYNDYSLGKWPHCVVARHDEFGYNEDGSFNQCGEYPGSWEIRI